MKHLEIESKWQNIWQQKQAYRADDNSTKPKYYALDMFPYPSGSGLHIGHIASYTPTDIVSRYKRAKGFNVLHPMGYDAFGLPAEQYAIQTGVHPSVTTAKAIESFRATLTRYGFSFDWSREISTCEPNYYKWTQFIFLKLFEKGLAYQKEVPVNWCPALKTVLANDEVVDGKSERGGHPVVRVPMKQWMLKITDYAERLLNDLDKLDWPERTKEGQRNWIGKSEGALVKFKIQKNEFEELSKNTEAFEIFTTRPDTIFGVSFMVLAPEHALVKQITSPEQKNTVADYIQATAKKSEVDRKAGTEKTGVFTGGFAVNPLTGKPVPVWIADYVMMDYGTGAIMAVPGHDQRDFEFAQKFKLPIVRVLESDTELPFTEDGKLCNSESEKISLNGLSKKEAIQKTTQYLEKSGLGKKQIQYKLRDWLFSRQRYWGEPFPILHTDDGVTKAVPVNELPVVLPQVNNFEPSASGEAPLGNNKQWVQYAENIKRETDTMPGAAGSSWYFLRYTDPQNSEAPYSLTNAKYWMPVDLYVGGAEHTVGHLLYSRFWTKVLFDCGLSPVDEPFRKLAHQGMILGPDGEKMSKSRGNVIPADEVANDSGVDALRCFVCFLGPMDKDKPWNSNGIDGVKRFLDRLTRLVVHEATHECIATDEELPPEIEKSLHKTIKKISLDIEALSFNTCISQMMILVNELYKFECKSKKVLLPLVQLLQPFAPHTAEELWSQMGGEGLVVTAAWPQYKPELCTDDVITLGVQVNGKMRGTIDITVDTTESDAVKEAFKVPTVLSAMAGKTPTKIIYKAGKILNLIAL